MLVLSRSKLAQCLLLLALTAAVAACGGGASNPPMALPAEATAEAADSTSSNGTTTATPTTDLTDNTNLPETSGTSSEPIDENSTAEEPNANAPNAEVDLSTPVLCNTDKQRLEDVMLAQINAARAEARMCGKTTSFPAAPSVKWNSKLHAAAEAHSADMSSHNFFSHTGSDGSSVSQRADSQAYEWRAIGENIAAGQETAQEVVEGWLESEGHCRNLMNSNYTEIAVACVSDTNADYQRYWTNVLGAPLR